MTLRFAEVGTRPSTELATVSETLARHIAYFPADQVPEAALSAAARSVLDAVGVSLAASGLEPACAPFRKLAKVQGRGACTILGWGDRTSPQGAALANGALAHAIDFEDVLDASPIHPDACTVAGALAIAEWRGDVGGRELLAAVAVGGDLVCRLALALKGDPGARGWYIPPILGAYGATAAAARLLGLDSNQTLDALALTLAQVTCPAQFKKSPHSSLRAVRDAFAAQAGVIATVLARDGVRGFDAPFEGEAGLFALYAGGGFSSDALVADLGERFHGVDLSFKLWPACRGTHSFIEAAAHLASDLSDPGAQIRQIEAVGADFLRFLAEPQAQKAAPKTAIDAKFSIPFTIASTLVHGAPSLESFGPECLSDPAVLTLARRVTFRPRPGSFRDANAGELHLHLRDGSVRSCVVQAALGHPTNPVGDVQLKAKFRACASHAATPLGGEATDAFIRAVGRLRDDPGPVGSTLLRHLHP